MADQPTPAEQRVEEIRAVLAEFDEADVVSLPVFYRVSPRFIANVRALLTDCAPLDQLERGHYSWLRTLCEGQEIKVKEADVRLAEVVAKFGAFTEDDVELLNRCADGCDGTVSAKDDDRVFADGIEMRMRDVRRLWSLARRITALLPPKSPI